MLRTLKFAYRVCLVLVTICVVGYLTVAGTRHFARRIQSPIFASDEVIEGYMIHQSGKCLSVEMEQLTLQHCRRDLKHQKFIVFADRVARADDGKKIVVQNLNSVGFGEYDDLPSLTYNKHDNKLQAYIDGARSCLVALKFRDKPCEAAELSFSSDCSNAEFSLVSDSEYLKQYWYRHTFTNFGCDSDICSINFIPKRLKPCENCTLSCKGGMCITVILETDDLTRVFNTMRTLIYFVELDLLNVVIVYSDRAKNTDKLRQRVERIDMRIRTYKTKSAIGSPGRLNAALSVVETPYFLLVQDDLVFSSTTNIVKMLEIIEHSDATIVAGNPRGSYHGLINAREEEDGLIELVLASDIWVADDSRWKNCHRVDFFPVFFLAQTHKISEIGGWDTSLGEYSHIALFVKAKAASLNSMFCTDVTAERRSSIKMDLQDVDNQYAILEFFGVDKLSLCETTRNTGRFLSCKEEKWSIKNCMEYVPVNPPRAKV